MPCLRRGLVTPEKPGRVDRRLVPWEKRTIRFAIVLVAEQALVLRVAFKWGDLGKDVSMSSKHYI